MLKRLTVSVIYNAHLSLFRETTNKNKMPSLHGGHTWNLAYSPFNSGPFQILGFY